MVWLSMLNLIYIQLGKNGFLFQYGLIIYTGYHLNKTSSIQSFYSNMVWLSIPYSLIKKRILYRFYSNMVWLSICLNVYEMESLNWFLFQYGLIIYFIVIKSNSSIMVVSIPIWSDYLSCKFITNIIFLTQFLFQYGLIIYKKTNFTLIIMLICFYSNMVWLSIQKMLIMLQ